MVPGCCWPLCPFTPWLHPAALARSISAALLCQSASIQPDQ